MDDYREQGHSTTLRDYVRVLFKRKWVILALWIAATVAGFVWLQGQKPTYVSTGTAIVIDADDLSIPIEEFPELFNFNWGKEMAYWTSPQAAPKVIAYLEKAGQLDDLIQYWFQDSEWVPSNREQKIEVIQDQIHRPYILGITGKGMLSVTARYTNPHVAHLVANGYLNAMKDDYQRKLEGAYQIAANRYDKEVAKAQIKKASAQKELDAYMAENAPPDVQSLVAEADQLGDKIADARSNVAVAQDRVNEMERQMQDVKSAIGRGDPALVAQYIDATHELASKAMTLRMLNEKVTALRVEGKSDRHPLVKKAVGDRDEGMIELKRGVQELLRDDQALAQASFRYSELKRQQQQARTQIVKAESTVEQLEEQHADLISRLEQAQSKRPIYDNRLAALGFPIRSAEESIAQWQFKKGQIQSAADARGDTDRIEILNPAPLPGRPINGSWEIQALFVSIAGLILGILAAFALDLFDHSYDRADIVERELGVSVLATFPEEKQS